MLPSKLKCKNSNLKAQTAKFHISNFKSQNTNAKIQILKKHKSRSNGREVNMWTGKILDAS